jgi:hypothetical protein
MGDVRILPHGPYKGLMVRREGAPAFDQAPNGGYMSNKALLGVLVALIGGVVAVPAGTAMAASCPPGTPVGPYCPNGGGNGQNNQDKDNDPTLVPGKPPKTDKPGDSVDVTIYCTIPAGCPGGILYLQPLGSFAKAHAAARGDYGQAAYGALAYGQTETITVPLTPAAKAALKKAGKLDFDTHAVSGTGFTKSLGVVTVAGSGKKVSAHSKAKAKPKKKHKTHAKVSPNFTG